MSYNRKKVKGWWNQVEKPKANGDIPDSLGIGVHEYRNGDGELMIFFLGTRLTVKSYYVVFGKYREPREDGRQFYVADRSLEFKNWAQRAVVTYHEDLLMAVSRIMEIKNQWDERHADVSN